MKKTIEEVAMEYANQFIDAREHYYGFIAGAKHQSEQMYSEEDMNEYAKWIYEDDGSLIDNNGHPKKESLQLWKKWKESKS